jgi:hypothetical protein
LEVGFNTDIEFSGSKYHVQTEDWGRNNPFLVTRIFQNGAVVKSVKTSYWQILLEGTAADSQAIRLALKDQHKRILDRLLSGQFDW